MKDAEFLVEILSLENFLAQKNKPAYDFVSPGGQELLGLGHVLVKHDNPVRGLNFFLVLLKKQRGIPSKQGCWRLSPRKFSVIGGTEISRPFIPSKHLWRAV